LKASRIAKVIKNVETHRGALIANPRLVRLVLAEDRVKRPGENLASGSLTAARGFREVRLDVVEQVGIGVEVRLVENKLEGVLARQLMIHPQRITVLNTLGWEVEPEATNVDAVSWSRTAGIRKRIGGHEIVVEVHHRAVDRRLSTGG
jgi:hypothetical protein